MLTREEYTARLEQYLEDLKAEIVAVEAELAELRVQA
jgi:ribosomal protein L29